MAEDFGKLNPDVKEFLVGKKTTRKISILPLSITDESAVFDKIVEIVVAGLTTWQADFGVQVARQAKDLIIQNIDVILERTTDPTEIGDYKLLDNITNIQLFEIVDHIWEVNFVGPLEKKGKSLWEKMMGSILPLLSSSPQSPSDTESLSKPSLDLSVEEA